MTLEQEQKEYVSYYDYNIPIAPDMTSQQHDGTDASKTFVELTTVQCAPNVIGSTNQKFDHSGVDRWTGTAIYWPPSQSELDYPAQYDVTSASGGLPGQEALQYLQYRNTHWETGQPSGGVGYAQQTHYYNNNTYHWPSSQPELYSSLPMPGYYDNQSHYEYTAPAAHVEQNPAPKNYEIPIRQEVCHSEDSVDYLTPPSTPSPDSSPSRQDTPAAPPTAFDRTASLAKRISKPSNSGGSSRNLSNNKSNSTTSNGSSGNTRGCRRQRTCFTPQQLESLEELFQTVKYPDVNECEDFASRLDLSEDTVRIWFKNRRAKEKRDIPGPNRKARRC